MRATLGFLGLSKGNNLSPESSGIRKGGRVGKTIAGNPLKSQNEYIRNAERKEKFLKRKDFTDRFIAPGQEDFVRFQPLYEEVRGIIDRSLIAQGLNPQEFHFYLADNREPNAYVVKHYNVIVVNTGLIAAFSEYALDSNVDDETRDALAFVIDHEIQHVMQFRREIDDGRVDEETSLIDDHVQDRAREYQSDLLALGLSDRSNFSVGSAPYALRAIVHYLEKRDMADSFWGSHPQIEERLRKVENNVKMHHWLNQGNTALPLVAVRAAQQRTSFREYQEQVISVNTSTGLIALLQSARNIDELQFAMLIGFDQLSATEKAAQNQVQPIFEQKLREFAGEDEAKRVFYEFIRDQIYIVLNLRQDDFDVFARLGGQLSAETVRGVLDLFDAPDLGNSHINVDLLQKTGKHKKAEAVLRRFNETIAEDPVNKPLDENHRFAIYQKRFVDGFYRLLIGKLNSGHLNWSEVRASLLPLTRWSQSSRSFWLTIPMAEALSLILHSPRYVSEMTPEDVRLMLGILENFYGQRPDKKEKRYSQALIVTDILHMARNCSLPAKEVLVDWVFGKKGKDELRKAVLREDLGSFFNTGHSVFSENTVVGYLQQLIDSGYGDDVMKQISQDPGILTVNDIISVQQQILRKLSNEHINGDGGVLDYLRWSKDQAKMFSGDDYDRVLIEHTPEALRPLLGEVSRDFKPLLYVLVLGGIPDNGDLNEALFGKITKANDKDILIIKAFVEYYRDFIKQRLVDKDVTVEQQDEAFSNLMTPLFLQAFFIEIGHDLRLQSFSGEVADNGDIRQGPWGNIMPREVARNYDPGDPGYSRPYNIVRFREIGGMFYSDQNSENFIKRFEFIARLPRTYEDAVDMVVKALPPSIVRNFILHRLFVEKILVQQTAYRVQDPEEMFDLKKIQQHLAALSPDQRTYVLTHVMRILPAIVHDKDKESENRGLWVSVLSGGRERYEEDAEVVRAEHGREIQDYEDVSVAVPGGPQAQMNVFFSQLFDGELKNIIDSTTMSLPDKRSLIEKYYPRASPAKDKWIKRAIQAEGSAITVEETEKFLSMIYNQELREKLALSALDQYRTENPNLFEQPLSEVLKIINRFFDMPSLVKDDILSETAQFLAKTDKEYQEVRDLYLDPFRKVESMDDRKNQRAALGQDILHLFIKEKNPVDKVGFLLWLMGITNDKPVFLVNFEYDFHVSVESFRTDFGRKQSKYYSIAGQSSQREALEPFLYGEKGIFNDGTAMESLLGGMFDFLIKEGSNKIILRKVFDKVFEKADLSRREEIFLSLVWTLSLQRGEMERNEPNMTPERQEARAVRMFLESLGLEGRQIAQVLSRSLWVSKTMRDELSQVQDGARRMDKGVVFDMVEKFGLSGRYKSIEEPLGSAKIAGVYRAVRTDGKVVALKVMRPEVEKTIESGVKFLKDVFDDDLKKALLAKGIFVPDSFIDQIEESFVLELNFPQEGKNTTELGTRVQSSVLKNIKEFSLRQLFGDIRSGEVKGDYEFYVPQIYEVFNNSLIEMEYVDGVKLSNVEKVLEAGLDLADIELAVANELLREIFYEGFYHGDPHLGNILVQKGKNGRVRVVLIDAGASFSISKVNRKLLGKLMTAIRDGQQDVLEDIVQRLGGTVSDKMRDELANKITQSTSSVGQRLLWFFHIIEKEQVKIPVELLNIMRFFATGQALFDRGNSGSTDGAQKDFSQADQLDRAIDQGQDQAGAAVENPGGIDLNEKHLDMEIKRDGDGIPLPVEAQDPALFNLQGLAPIILEIAPVTPSQMPVFSELQQPGVSKLG